MVGERGSDSAFQAMARVLAPESGRSLAVVELGPRWQSQGFAPAIGEWTIWGNLPARGLSVSAAVAFALARERAIRRLRRSDSGSALRVLHRLPPATHAGGLGGPIRKLLLQGAAAELTTSSTLIPIYEQVIAASGSTAARPRLDVNRDGSVRIKAEHDGTPVLVRLGTIGGIADPRRAAEGLRTVGAYTDRAPALIGSGLLGEVGWSIEALLQGRPPRRLTPDQWREVAGILQQLAVRSEHAGGAFRDQAASLAAMLPGYASVLDRALAQAIEEVGRLPAVIQHGDLFHENVLADHRRVTGIVDWGTWMPSGTPGVDLLELYATERRRRKPAEFARVLTEGSWFAADFQHLAASYWAAIDVEPTRTTLRAVAAAWWTSGVTGWLARPGHGRLADDAGWLTREIGAAVRWLGQPE